MVADHRDHAVTARSEEFSSSKPQVLVVSDLKNPPGRSQLCPVHIDLHHNLVGFSIGDVAFIRRVLRQALKGCLRKLQARNDADPVRRASRHNFEEFVYPVHGLVSLRVFPLQPSLYAKEQIVGMFGSGVAQSMRRPPGVNPAKSEGN